MNEIIKIQTNDKHEPIVSGRELHAFLEVKTSYKDWFPRMIEYGFTEGVDFNPLIFEQVQIEGKREVSRQLTDHHVKLDMAKELAMIQRTAKGKQARLYFLEVEKAYNSPEQIMARALLVADNTIRELQEEKILLSEKIAKDTPKVLFADAVSGSDGKMLVGLLAKFLKQNGFDIGQKRLFAKLREDGFLMKTSDGSNIPTQKSMNLGLFVVKERVINSPDKEPRLTYTTLITAKGQKYFINYFLGKQNI